MTELSRPAGQEPVTFAAVIAHADEPAMLRRCIAHHLSIGVQRIFVSLNLGDPQSEHVIAEFPSDMVRGARLEAFAPEPVDYFTAAVQAVCEWVCAEWLLFADSDEFWIPADGTLTGTALLPTTDVYSVQRFNVPPIRDSSGTIRNLDALEPASTLVIGARFTMDAAYLEHHPATPWIAAKILPKIMVRPQLVERVGVGAHDCVTRRPDVARTVPRDLLIAHLPFTSEARFRRKVDAIRAWLQAHPDHFGPGEAWHWRRWLQLADAGALTTEFAAQVLDEVAVTELVARGVLLTPSDLFRSGRLGIGA